MKHEMKAYDTGEIYDEDLKYGMQSLAEYLSLFISFNDQVKTLDDSRVLLYRGQANTSFNLAPGVFRNGLLKHEHEMIEKLLLQSCNDFSEVIDPFERLVKMQHYKLPTRLLDLTSNPLVALYFACTSHPDADGEIFVFYDYLTSYKDLTVRAISSITEYFGKSERGLRDFLNKQGFSLSSIDINELIKTPYVLIEPPMNNERIKRQSGAFALVGVRKDNRSFEKEIFCLRNLIVKEESENIERSITIPRYAKAQLLDELDAIGINQAFLFPELEHQAAYLKKKYEES